ncbi:Tn7-like transposition protein A [Geobacillus stearothermophilus]|uniref:Tn7-like transposition protein A n=1 Tax=Geobacillus stearothermophilus TaxID=1422 RepID=A0ABQ7HAS5_GEOSE|nr:TnsA endonuclease N-terminal domain-containing protein [Geobacillus stearothermophilus]KAF6509299.1 Tn7-like transposition protein A [Geobacillus stearothermophilus]RLP97676.1 heteromeric transposase endonuclease subunit TnsA [Geobacillus stearothermophilus]
MSRYKSTNENQYSKLIKEGRGQGVKQDYKPWLTVRDVPSEGLSTRIAGWKTGRIHHFLSKLELSFFYVLEWASAVTDIREQYPLPLEATIEIADKLGIKHPAVPKTQERAVMTTDFLIDVYHNDQPKLLARSIKPSTELASNRVIEKIMIEKTYWEEQGIDFKVVTEREIPMILSKNVEFIYMAKHLSDSPGITEDLLWKLEPFIYQKMQGTPIPLAKIALEVDEIIGLEPGTSLWIVKHLIANRYWEVDMYETIDTSKPLNFSRADTLLDKGRVVI